eukprot:TRINITY_DN21489_c0_g1_i1.p1 TRINITY_DN21489_c0_g1~~TRINITY_DN21489_c0_g1_i1.p1  ORF type:complete len:245 (+),score=26.96 TRINITY_DN21489_c0_g1_i1:38-772(+)
MEVEGKVDLNPGCGQIDFQACNPGPETCQDEDLRPWALRSRLSQGFPRTKVVLGLIVPMAIVFVIALAIGIPMNKTFTGDAFGGGNAAVKQNDHNADRANAAPIKFNAVHSACASAAVASGMAAVRFCARVWTHPRVYGVFSFVSYVVLATTLLYQVYGGRLTVITSAGSSGLSNQIYDTLGSEFNWEDAKFSTKFSDISQTSDFWNWMRGPFKNFLLSPTLNAYTDQLPVNAPAMQSNPAKGA